MVKYQAGELIVISYKNGAIWAEESIKTTDKASKLELTVDRSIIKSDGEDLAFITVKITDKNGLMVSDANNKVNFSIEGSGEIVATDNGDPANLVSFASHERDAYNGLALVIVRAKKGSKGVFKLVVHSDGLEKAAIEIQSN